MSPTKIQQGTIALFVTGFAALCVAGCDCPKKLKSLQEQNQLLSQQVADLEQRLQPADAAALAADPAKPQAAAGQSVYTVLEGDSLWSIAKEQLGSGTRYKEIVALNPNITRDTSLTIGMKLKMPSR